VGDSSNRVIVSAATAWEIATKVSIGKLRMPDPTTWFDAALTRDDFRPLAISTTHALQAPRLPWHHRDPFDRLLIAQAIAEALTVVTGDRQFERYQVRLLPCW
jgi:PIN domain nuclease of toxin-antitoxin system